MKVKFDIPKYSSKDGFIFSWNKEAIVSIENKDGEVVIRGNTIGLQELGRLLFNISQESLKNGYHIHLDPEVHLSNKSSSLIVIREKE